VELLAHPHCQLFPNFLVYLAPPFFSPFLCPLCKMAVPVIFSIGFFPSPFWLRFPPLSLSPSCGHSPLNRRSIGVVFVHMRLIFLSHLFRSYALIFLFVCCREIRRENPTFFFLITSAATLILRDSFMPSFFADFTGLLSTSREVLKPTFGT